MWSHTVSQVSNDTSEKSYCCLLNFDQISTKPHGIIQENRNNVAHRYGKIKLYKPKPEIFQTSKQLNPSKANWIIIIIIIISYYFLWYLTKQTVEKDSWFSDQAMDRVKYEVLFGVNEERNILQTTKLDWVHLVYKLPSKHVIKVNVEGMKRGGRSRKYPGGKITDPRIERGSTSSHFLENCLWKRI